MRSLVTGAPGSIGCSVADARMSPRQTPQQIAELRRQHYNATLVWQRRIHSELMLLRVRSDFPRPPHQPGQYSTLGLGYWEPRVSIGREEILAPGQESKLARRSYSISCSILDAEGRLQQVERTDWLEFYVVLVRNSERQEAPAFTPRLFLLREGDRLALGTKIAGHFTLEPVTAEDTVVFLSTGTGEAPHNYMLWELLRRGHTGRILAACCVRYRRDLAYLGVHEELMRRYPNYAYLTLTTRETQGVQSKVYIQELITSGQLEERLGQPLDPARTHVFLCGNPKMIGVPTKDRQTGQRLFPQPPGVIELLERRGFQIDDPQAKVKGAIHFEKYW